MKQHHQGIRKSFGNVQEQALHSERIKQVAQLRLPFLHESVECIPLSRGKTEQYFTASLGCAKAEQAFASRQITFELIREDNWNDIVLLREDLQIRQLRKLETRIPR